MSHFTVAINGLLDRMKNDAQMTRQQFAGRIGMSLSTLSSYTTGRSRPDASALRSIVSGLEGPDARRIVVAHLQDETPDALRAEISLGVQSGLPPGQTIEFPDDDEFRHNIGLLVEEARSNEHVIGFVAELIALLGLKSREPKLWPVDDPPFPVQRVPMGPVHAKRSASTPSFEETTKDSGKKRASSTRGRKTNEREK
jgi:transcriptional regulator with XRE-family HTH domain